MSDSSEPTQAEPAATPTLKWLVPVLAGLIGTLAGAVIGGLSSAWVANLQYRHDTAGSIREARLAAYEEFLWTLNQIDLEMDERINAWHSASPEKLDELRGKAEANEEQFRRAGSRALLVATENVIPHINRLIYRQIEMFSETNPQRAGGLENARSALREYRLDHSRLMAEFMREARQELGTV